MVPSPPATPSSSCHACGGPVDGRGRCATCPPDPGTEPPTTGADHAGVVVAGGVASAGQVVRLGDRVRRPRRPQSESVHTYLRHLRAHGADWVPEPLALTGTHEELAWIEGATPALAATADADDLLEAVARRQLDLHRRSADFRPGPDAVWAVPYLPGGCDGPLVCHNDLSVANVVVTPGGTVALVDFDYAAPVDPLFDVAVAVRHWAPVADPADLDQAQYGLDQLGRIRRWCDVFELPRDRRVRLVEIVGAFLDVVLDEVERRAALGAPGFAALWADGYADRNRRARRWLDSVAHRLER